MTGHTGQAHAAPERRNIAARLALGLIRGYQLLVSPLLGPRCRFLPTCSSYAEEAVRRHGALAGGWLAVKRVCRCHPFGGSGYDPVPGGDAAVHGTGSVPAGPRPDPSEKRT